MNLRHLLTAVITGLTAVGLALMIPGNSYIVIASIAAATTGVVIQRKTTTKWPPSKKLGENMKLWRKAPFGD